MVLVLPPVVENLWPHINYYSCIMCWAYHCEFEYCWHRHRLDIDNVVKFHSSPCSATYIRVHSCYYPFSNLKCRMYSAVWCHSNFLAGWRRDQSHAKSVGMRFWKLYRVRSSHTYICFLCSTTKKTFMHCPPKSWIISVLVWSFEKST